MIVPATIASARVPLVGVAAPSGAGKTTLLLKLLPLLTARGVRVGMIKHAHHTFEIDHPGKDSYGLRHSGAAQVAIASRRRWALIVEAERGDAPSLDEMVERLHQDALDLVLVEGYRHEAYPKIELHRPSLGHPALFPSDPHIIAVATDATLETETTLPVFDINAPRPLAEFILSRVALPSASA